MNKHAEFQLLQPELENLRCVILALTNMYKKGLLTLFCAQGNLLRSGVSGLLLPRSPQDTLCRVVKEKPEYSWRPRKDFENARGIQVKKSWPQNVNPDQGEKKTIFNSTKRKSGRFIEYFWHQAWKGRMWNLPYQVLALIYV